ncbi:MAG TPA: hypothetical protein VMW39_02215 [bacterium]|nr:hypothetical protein [bacterium]
MKNYFDDDAIVAISTLIGKSGIGIVRLSGKGKLCLKGAACFTGK